MFPLEETARSFHLIDGKTFTIAQCTTPLRTAAAASTTTSCSFNQCVVGLHRKQAVHRRLENRFNKQGRATK